MTDFLVPVLVGAAAALLPLLVAWYVQRRRDSVTVPGSSLVGAVRGWLRRATPGSPEVTFIAAPPEAFIVAAPPRGMTATRPQGASPPGAVEPSGVPSGGAVARSAPVPTDPPEGGLAAAGVVDAPGAPVTTPDGIGDTRSHVSVPPDEVSGSRTVRPERPRRASPARTRSTIQLDPLDTPVDGRRARITVGALIDDLELAKLGRRA